MSDENITPTYPTEVITPAPRPTLESARERLNEVFAELSWAFPEREAIVQGLCTALIAGEHVLLVGPPGTAKSALARSFAASFGASCFEHLLTRYTTPDEILGPFSLRGLEEDRLVRKTAGRLPEADVAFLDEAFKASSAILNALLGAINERQIEDDGARRRIPLRMVIAASNELPIDDDGLEAFRDRLLLAYEVAPLTGAQARLNLLMGALGAPPKSTATLDDVAILADAARSVTFGPGTVEALLGMVDKLRSEGVPISDRRLAQAARLLRAHAAWTGSTTIELEALGILKHVLWATADQVERVAAVVDEATALPWKKDVKEAHKEIAALASAFRKARQSSTSSATIQAFATTTDALKRLNTDVVQRIEKTWPAAHADVESLASAINALSTEMMDTMHVLGKVVER